MEMVWGLGTGAMGHDEDGVGSNFVQCHSLHVLMHRFPEQLLSHLSLGVGRLWLLRIPCTPNPNHATNDLNHSI